MVRRRGLDLPRSSGSVDSPHDPLAGPDVGELPAPGGTVQTGAIDVGQDIADPQSAEFRRTARLDGSDLKRPVKSPEPGTILLPHTTAVKDQRHSQQSLGRWQPVGVLEESAVERLTSDKRINEICYPPEIVLGTRYLERIIFEGCNRDNGNGTKPARWYCQLELFLAYWTSRSGRKRPYAGLFCPRDHAFCREFHSS